MTFWQQTTASAAKYKLVIVIAVFTLLNQATVFLPSRWNLVGWIFVVGVVGLAAYMKKKEIEPDLRFEERREFFLDDVCLSPMERLREFDDTARLNIMLIEGLGPKESRSLKIIYDQFVTDDHPDRYMPMGITQGVCGDAVAKGEFGYADVSGPDRPAFRLDMEQLKKTERVTFVMSMPIFKMKEGPNGRPFVSKEVIGVINIDSEQPDPESYYGQIMIEDESAETGVCSLLGAQTHALKGMSLYCSYILT